VAIDRVPDPAGTLRAMISRDPRWFRSLTAMVDDGSRAPLSLASVMDGRLAGIEFRAAWRVRVPPAPGSGPDAEAEIVLAPGALLRHGMPWVVWSLERIVAPAPGIANPDLASTLRVDSVEAAFAVALDPEDRWQMTRIRLL
jgi:hypothetical protein